MKEIHIDDKEHLNVMSTFWTMLKECESKADCNDDIVLKNWVEQWYGQWNRVTDDNKQPIWSTRN